MSAAVMVTDKGITDSDPTCWMDLGINWPTTLSLVKRLVHLRTFPGK